MPVDQELLKEIVLFTTFTEFIPLILCVIYRKKLVNKELKVFFIYAISKSLFAVASIIAAQFLAPRAVFQVILRTDFIFQFILLSYFFWLIIQNRNFRKLIGYFAPLFVIYCIYDMAIYLQKNTNTPATLGELQYFIIGLIYFLMVIIFFLFEKMRLNYDLPVYQTINFWLSVGLFVFFAGIFFLMLLVENYSKQNAASQLEWTLINSFVNILKNLILGLAFTVKEPKEIPDDQQFSIPLEMNLDSFSPSNNLN